MPNWKKVITSGSIAILNSLTVDNKVTAKNHVDGFQELLTTNGTTILTSNSPRLNWFSGSLSHTLLLPLTTTLSVGEQYEVDVDSTNPIFVQASDGSSVQSMTKGSHAVFTCNSNIITGSVAWDSTYHFINSLTSSNSSLNILYSEYGIVDLTVNNSYLLNSSSYSISSSYSSTAISSSYALSATSASFAISAQTASYLAGGAALSGGTTNYIPLWVNNTSQTSSKIYQSGSNLAINDTTFDPLFPESLRVSGSSINVITGKANVNTYTQLNIINTNNGTSASADLVATNDTGGEYGNYVNLGINSSTFGYVIGDPNDSYLYATGSNLLIGNVTPNGPNAVKIFSGNNATNFPIIVTGSTSLITGSVFGTTSTASFVTLARSASYILQAQSASFATQANTSLTGSYVLLAQSASYAATASFMNMSPSIKLVSASYTLLISDMNTMIGAVSGAGNINIIIPATSSVNYAINSRVDVTQLGAGTVTFVTSSGVAIQSQLGSLVLNGINTAATLIYYSGSGTVTSNWLLIGNLSASYATSVNSASFATTASYARSGSFVPITGSASISGSFYVSGSVGLKGQVTFGGPTPTIVSGSGAGTVATISLMAGSTNNGGVIKLTTGTAPTANGIVGTLTYSSVFPTGSSVIITPITVGSTGSFIVSGSASTFVMSSTSPALPAATAMSWNYQIAGY